LVQVSDSAPLQGARVQTIQGERTVASDVTLDEAIKPVAEFCRELAAQISGVGAEVEAGVSVGFTQRGHAYLAHGSAHGVVDLKVRIVGAS